MPSRTWLRHIDAHVRGSSLIVLIRGACVRTTAPVARIRRTASAATPGSSSRGWEKWAISASVFPEATTWSKSRRVSSASGSLTKRCGQ
jgi:hypothetical protein